MSGKDESQFKRLEHAIRKGVFGPQASDNACIADLIESLDELREELADIKQVLYNVARLTDESKTSE